MNTGIYIGLFDGDPNGEGVELQFKGYKRVLWDQAAVECRRGQLAMVNSNQLTFPVNTDDAVEVTHVGVFNAPQGGDRLRSTSLDRSVTLDTEMKLAIHSGSLVVTMLDDDFGNRPSAFNGFNSDTQ